MGCLLDNLYLYLYLAHGLKPSQQFLINRNFLPNFLSKSTPLLNTSPKIKYLYFLEMLYRLDSLILDQ